MNDPQFSDEENKILTDLEDWPTDQMKVYRYIREFMPTDYLVVYMTPHKTFKSDKGESTYKTLPEMTKYEFMDKILANELQFVKNWDLWTDVRSMKVGSGCTCGSWATRGNSNLHYPDCMLYRKP